MINYNYNYNNYFFNYKDGIIKSILFYEHRVKASPKKCNYLKHRQMINFMQKLNT